MRYIKIDEIMRIADLSDLEKACIEMEKLTTDKERKKYIEDNADKWSSIRDKLWLLGKMKCWYSEAKIQEGEGEVEHYRPKGKVCKSKHKGYSWLAFKWCNYRLAHGTCNIRRTDYLTKKKAGKGAYFPLKDERKRAYTPEEIRFEEPVLLDPVVLNDVKLLSFNQDSGRPEPSPFCKNEEWNVTRVKETIGYYHLDEGTWNKDRYDIAKAVTNLCKKIIEARQQADIKKEDALIDELINNYANNYAPFSSVAFQIIRENGLSDIVLY